MLTGLVAYSALLIGISVLPLSSATNNSLSSIYFLEFRLDHLLHVLIFTIWGGLASMNANKLAKERNKTLFYLFLVGLGLAVLTEYVQKFLPYRGYNVNDLLGNVIGIFLSFGVIFATEAHRRRRST